MSELFDSLNFPRSSRHSRRPGPSADHSAASGTNSLGESSKSHFTPQTSSRTTRSSRSTYTGSTPGSADSQCSPRHAQPAVFWHASPSPTLVPARRADPAPPMATQEFTSHIFGAHPSRNQAMYRGDLTTPSRPGSSSNAATGFKRLRESHGSGRSSLDSPSGDPPSLPRSISAPNHARKRFKRSRISRSGTLPDLARLHDDSGASMGDINGKEGQSSDPISSEAEDRSRRVQRMLLDLNEQLNSLGSGSDGERLGAGHSDGDDTSTGTGQVVGTAEPATATGKWVPSRSFERSTSFPLEHIVNDLPHDAYRTSPKGRVGLSTTRSATDVFSSSGSNPSPPKKRLANQTSRDRSSVSADGAFVHPPPRESTPPRMREASRRQNVPPPAALRAQPARQQSISPTKEGTSRTACTKSTSTAAMSRPFVLPTNNKAALQSRQGKGCSDARRAGPSSRTVPQTNAAVSMSQQFRSPLTRASPNVDCGRSAPAIKRSAGSGATNSVRRSSHSPAKSSKVSGAGLEFGNGRNGVSEVKATARSQEEVKADVSSDDSFGLSFDMDIDEIDRKMAEAEQALR